MGVSTDLETYYAIFELIDNNYYMERYTEQDYYVLDTISH